MEEVVAPVLVMWAITVAVIAIVITISNNNRRRRAAETQAEMQSKLLDKLATSQELAEFLRTETGQRLLQSAGTETEPIRPPHAPILRSIQMGTILTLSGLAFLVLAFWEADTVENFPLRLLGVLCGAVGLGFLISSAISYTLGKSWGLFNGDKGTERP